ncbi:MAG: NADH dehydrogenase [Dehalococcoidia bacterium]|nr:NADH dehydrogenase [Dehalococcoidia bacterium]
MSAEEIAGNTFSVLPLLAVLIPMVAAVAVVAIGERNEKLRNLIAFLAALAALGVVLAIAIHVMRGALLYFDLAIMQVGHGISVALAVDPLAACLSVIAAILWVAAMAHSSAYMGHEHKRTRFFAAMMVTEAAILGMFMVQDFLSLFVFFEIMGLAAYFLVVHTETDKAQRAATKYLVMTIIGGLSLLMGIFLYLGHAGTVGFVPPPQSGFLTGPLRVAPLVCMVAGFGVKAGIVPLHVWLPDAHPVAPSPASALLSGIMIKAGAYGIIRTVTSYFHVPPPDIQSLGLALIGIAIVTAFIGMVLAVRQSDLKTTLAYSSISQMGFLLLGVGCLAFLGEGGAIGLGAGLYHITSHAFFKGCLFLAAGSILYCTHETNIFSLGGLWRKMPVTTVIWCIAVLGLMGIPLFNGFVSKSMLHHAIVEAQYLAAAGGPHATWLQAVEVLYTVIAAGTILYGLKMTYYVFFRRPSEEASRLLEKVREAPGWMLAGAGLLAAGVLAAGLAPGSVLRHLIIPAVGMFEGLDPFGVAHLGDLDIYSWYYVKDILLPLALGAGLFAVLTARARSKNREATHDPFYFGLPSWLSVDRWYVQGARGLVQACFGSEAAFSRAREAVFGIISSASMSLYRSAREASAPLMSRYANDIALGALFIALSLALFLILTIV